MIYLFDDKEARQQSYGWTTNEFEIWNDTIVRIKNFSDFSQLNENDILNGGNIILYHESFATCIPYEERQNYQSFHKSILDGSYLDGISIVIFSGSITTRAINGNIAYVPVIDMYSNLKCFLKHHCNLDTDFKYLLWGEEYQIEQTLFSLIESCSNEIYEKDEIRDWSNVFFASAQKYSVDAPADNCIQKKLWLSKVSDENFDSYIYEWFNETEYDSLYIPLCFGNILSDFNGLRLAIHIRCTKSRNQGKPIYIYSPVPLSSLIGSRHFDILKTKGVKLIGMQHKEILESYHTLSSIELPNIENEMKKVNLPMPQNFDDNHSIANIWAIYRWAIATNAEDLEISKVIKTIKSNLYFKHLCTIFPPSNIEIFKETELKFKDMLLDVDNKLIGQKNINILYVDDEAGNGWYEIMANIIYDINRIKNFYCIGEDLKSLTAQEIIDLVTDRVKKESINVLLLDFRLHAKDFEATNIKDVTSVQILKRIKEYNPGIQVVMFSATNKVWNLLALQNYGADAFVIKEGQENSKDSTFTVQVIKNFINMMSVCISNRYKKNLYQNFSEVNDKLEREARNYRVDKGLQKAVKLFYEMAYSSLPLSVENPCFDHSFMNYFRIIEAIASEIIDTDTPEVKQNDKTGAKRYFFKFRGTDDYLRDYDEEEFTKTGKKLSLPKKSIPFVQKLYNLFARLGVYSSATFDLVQKRNALTHPNLRTNDRIEPITLNDVLLTANISFQCLNKIISNQEVS